MRFLRATAHTPFQPVKPMQRHTLESTKNSQVTNQAVAASGKPQTRR